MSVFSDRLRTTRETMTNYSQKEFAEKVNIAANTYNGYETGNRMPNLQVVTLLADALGVSVDYLLGRTNIKNYEEETIAAHTDDRTQSLSEEDKKQLDDFIDFLITKAKKNE